MNINKCNKIENDKNEYNTICNKRSFWSYIFGISLYFFVRLTCLIIHSYIRINKTDNKINLLYESSNSFIKIIESCGCKIHISGISNLSSVDKQVIFVSNHMSTLDIFLLPGILFEKKPSVFIMRKGFEKIPFFYHIMKSSDNITVGKQNPKEDFLNIINESKKRIQSGKSIIVFPQGTRSSKFDTKKFNTIGVKLAKYNKVPILPIAIKTDFWENGKIIKEIGTINRNKDIYVEIGKPIFINENKYDREYNEIIINYIDKKLKEWNDKSEWI